MTVGCKTEDTFQLGLMEFLKLGKRILSGQVSAVFYQVFVA
jgi:hypothetical protein